jgi:hypothetical protein
MLQSGRVAFGAMETVVFGKPAAETVAEEVRRRDAERVFLMVSGTLNPDDRRDHEGAPRARQPVCRPVRPHATAHAAACRDRGRRNGARGRGRPDRDRWRRLDHRRRQGSAAVPRQQRPQRRGDRRPEAGQGPGRRTRPAARDEAALSAPGHLADDIVGRRVQRLFGDYRRAAPDQGIVPPPTDHSAR